MVATFKGAFDALAAGQPGRFHGKQPVIFSSTESS